VRAEIWPSDRRPFRTIENGGLNPKGDHSADESVRKSVWHAHLMKKKSSLTVWIAQAGRSNKDPQNKENKRVDW
jgi:hypothetical protein